MSDGIRPGVAELVQLGPMPTDDEATNQPVRAARWEQLVGELNSQGNVTDEEAACLVELFPRDDSDSFGVAWTLVHVIESSPSWPDAEALARTSGPWADLLRQRAGRSSG